MSCGFDSSPGCADVDPRARARPTPWRSRRRRCSVERRRLHLVVPVMSADDSGLYGIFARIVGEGLPVPHGDAIERREARAQPASPELHRAALLLRGEEGGHPGERRLAVFHPAVDDDEPRALAEHVGLERPGRRRRLVDRRRVRVRQQVVKGREKSVRVACCSSTTRPRAPAAPTQTRRARCCVAIETADRGETRRDVATSHSTHAARLQGGGPGPRALLPEEPTCAQSCRRLQVRAAVANRGRFPSAANRPRRTGT